MRGSGFRATSWAPYPRAKVRRYISIYTYALHVVTESLWGGGGGGVHMIWNNPRAWGLGFGA